MPERFSYDMSHYSHITGNIGRLQTVKCIHVVAGESWEFNIEGICRQAPLRRDLTVDGVVDTFAFYVPYRHIYGDDWITFMEDGINETVDFPSGPTYPTLADAPAYLGFPIGTWANEVPLHYCGSYNRIWNWYFRSRSDESSRLADNHIAPPGDLAQIQYGQLISRLPSQWSDLLDSANKVADQDRKVPSATEVDIVDFAKQKGHYESEIMRHWFGNEYSDLIGSMFGGSVSHDAEEKPILLYHDRTAMSGHDIDGTDEVSLGTYAGKSTAPINCRIPRRFIPEHGTVWIMQTMRYPTVHPKEHNRLAKELEFDYEMVSGDPDIYRNSEPVTVESQDVFSQNAATNDLGQAPYGYWYRHEPSYVSDDFYELQGFPFVPGFPASYNQGFYHVSGDYDDMYQTLQLGHWRSHLRIGARKMSPVPPAISSIYAGI